MQSIEQVTAILADTLSLGGRGTVLAPHTRLLGNLPELDSMAVVSVIAALEEHFGIVFEDDDIDAGAFETVGTLSALVDHKCAH